LKKEAKRGDLNLEVAGKKLELYDYSFTDEPSFTCEQGSVRLDRSCGKNKPNILTFIFKTSKL